MRYLLDTHAFVWAMTLSPRLSETALRLIGDDGTDIFVSAVSVYEIELLQKLGRLETFPISVAEAVARYGYRELPIGLHHAELAGRLPLNHRDPWDRLLSAQGLLEGLPVISKDKAIEDLGAERIW